jgi:hypothetical protein
MKKITLDVEALEVSTFETATVEPKPGTVEAYDASKATCGPRVITCLDYTCIGPGCWQD